MSWQESLASATPTFFRRFAEELEKLASDLDHFQAAVQLSGAGDKGEDAVVRAQSLDEIVQRGRALADIAHHLTIEAPSNDRGVGRILEEVRLAALADRLAGVAHVAGSEGGEFDLF